MVRTIVFGGSDAEGSPTVSARRLPRSVNTKTRIFIEPERNRQVAVEGGQVRYACSEPWQLTYPWAIQGQ
jgi:hypothetical protein